MKFQENENLCQSEINVETPVEHNIENLIIIDNSDDEPLLHIPQISNNQKNCSKYSLEMTIGISLIIFLIIIIIPGIVFLKYSKEPSQLINGCNKKSQTGKSYSIDNLKTIAWLNKLYLYTDVNRYHFMVYTALSNKTILTFSFNKGGKWYLDDVSICDTINGDELIEDGGFESGTLYAYCVCDSTFSPTKPTTFTKHTGSFVYDANTFFSSIQLSQTVNTILGRNYNISFWIQSETLFHDDDHAFSVYISLTLNINQYFKTLLFKKFIIIVFGFFCSL